LGFYCPLKTSHSIDLYFTWTLFEELLSLLDDENTI
jgi:hypothetical protein